MTATTGRFALAYTRRGTTQTFWLNRWRWGGFIWSLVRSSEDERDDQYWNQPALRFETTEAAQAFIDAELAGNEDARVVCVND